MSLILILPRFPKMILIRLSGPSPLYRLAGRCSVRPAATPELRRAQLKGPNNKIVIQPQGTHKSNIYARAPRRRPRPPARPRPQAYYANVEIDIKGRAEEPTYARPRARPPR